ncbi:hypothetical protein EC912_102270 [Luteibacter rhizovicinus]|uniref:Uncharacterized protein n=1 Tax=Luteibacter rhizovicinus TaxID=242606 RepID=A0A4R3YSF0_9GAMM|nr:hypothetical protein [Luteibacter rhizovicinus]TCV95925.1 hypothetical protein EC912_102270 [Luteibacter rhizovicinus]
MSIDEAQNSERQERMTAERAYELFWAELLDAGATFACVGTGCTAPLICACLDKPEQTLRVRPYFRSRRIEDHAETCEVLHGTRSGTRKPETPTPDVFELERPADHFRASPQPGTPSVQTAREAPATKKSSGLRTGASHYYRLSSVVQKFLEHRRDGTLAEATVAIGGETPTYEALFRNVYRQKVEDITGVRAIWWGTAYVQRLKKENGYFIRFTRAFRTGEQETKPTITLGEKLIEVYPVRKLLRARLDKLIAETGGYCVVFVWAKPWTPAESEASFVRFYVNNPDHIDIRGPEVLEELKQTSRIARAR